MLWRAIFATKPHVADDYSKTGWKDSLGLPSDSSRTVSCNSKAQPADRYKGLWWRTIGLDKDEENNVALYWGPILARLRL